MRSVPLAVGTLAMSLCACGRAERRPDSASGSAMSAGSSATAAPATSTPAAPALSISQLEGTWHGKSFDETSDSVRATWTLTAPSDTTKWVTRFTNGPSVQVHVIAVAGDSAVAEMGPYKSVSRKGQMMKARFVTRVHGDTLVGTYEMRPVAKPDSVFRGRLTAVRGH